MSFTSPLVVPLRGLDRSSLALTGGKAANLGELMRAGFNVPDGFCVTTEAYKLVAGSQGIGSRLPDLLAGLEKAGDSAGAAIRELLCQAAIPNDIRREVVAAYQPLAAYPVAVRSSATAEDLPEASFAGQQETYLDILGEEALLEALRRCWASLWTDRAIAYRQRHGIPQTSVSLAVVVQRMVAAEAGGVMFTANPVSGKRTEVTIEASLGLGDAVVSGLVSPDSYVVEKRTLSLISREVSAKTVQVTPVPGGGTAKVEVPDDASSVEALPDDAIIELARLGLKIEEHFGWPQDVEWAFSGGELYFVQSRPITSLYPAPPNAPEGELHVYVSANFFQGIVEPLTPMGACVFTVTGQVLRTGPRLVVLGGRIFADFTTMLRTRPWRDMLLRFSLPQIDPVAGRIVERLLADPRLRPVRQSARGAARKLLARYWRTILPILARVASSVAFPAAARRRVTEKVVPRLAALREEAYAPRALGQQAEFVQRFTRDGLREVFFPHLIPLVAGGMLCLKRAEALVHEWGLDERLMTVARQGLPHNMTTTMDLELWALAQRLRADAASREALTTGGPPALAVRYFEGALPETAQRGIAAFLARYGHRGLREIDIGVPRWKDDPAYLFGILQNYLALEDQEKAPDRHFAAQAAAGERAVAELVAQARRLPGGWLKAAMLGFFLRRYRQLGGLRETPKFYVVWMFEALRDMLLGAGRELTKLGRLDQPEDIFFLTIDDQWNDGGLDLRKLVVDRRRAYETELHRRRPPHVITSEGEAFYGEALAAGENMLAGTGVSPGVARGKARVVHNPAGARLEPGEILVAPSTDPAWTPLFLTAGGLIMEAGGMMSHGAIVAREYGIPAVVGIPEATNHIAPGQEVEVDGNQGLVRIS
ncbi:MAG: phosphoenolpyruvate synthase [Chloroflexi bacterium]|nr:phosphoenolpyruvate synthase [Chloroflexota bacterium]